VNGALKARRLRNYRGGTPERRREAQKTCAADVPTAIDRSRSITPVG
jgi:hypothetical protein